MGALGSGGRERPERDHHFESSSDIRDSMLQVSGLAATQSDVSSYLQEAVGRLTDMVKSFMNV
jgi:hypothetical protein